MGNQATCRSILIVDDDPVLCSVLRTLLAGEYGEYKIKTAETGAYALEACVSSAPQLVLLDVHLPDANGIDLIPVIRKIAPSASVIVISSYEGAAYANDAFARGATDYVNKFRLATELVPAINRALKGSAQK